MQPCSVSPLETGFVGHAAEAVDDHVGLATPPSAVPLPHRRGRSPGGARGYSPARREVRRMLRGPDGTATTTLAWRSGQ